MLSDTDLRDPAPPTPGAAERDAVAARAHQIVRRRRLAESSGVLGAVAVLAIGVAAFAGGGSGQGTQRVAVANTPSTGAAVHTASVSGHVAIAAGATLHIQLSGDGGTFATDADASGNFSLSGLPAGAYQVLATLDVPSGDPNLGSAQQVVRANVTLSPGANSFSPTF